MKKMSLKKIFGFILFLAAAAGVGVVGCNKSAQSPVAPLRAVGLSISVPITSEIKSNLLGSSSNNLLYKFTAPGLTPVTGSFGPFNASGNSGSVEFFATLPSGAPWLMAVELDDAPSRQPLAIGAAQLPDGTATGSVSLDMGSVARNCYRIDTWQDPNGSSFSFMNENLLPTTLATGSDISLVPVAPSGFQIQAVNPS